jgi:hypothetical protein
MHNLTITLAFLTVALMPCVLAARVGIEHAENRQPYPVGAKSEDANGPHAIPSRCDSPTPVLHFENTRRQRARARA